MSVWGSETAVASALNRIFGKLNSSGQPFLAVPRPNQPEKQLRTDFECHLEISSASVLAPRTLEAIEDSTGVKITLEAPELEKVRLKLLGKPVPLHYAIAELHSLLGPDAITEMSSDGEPVPLTDNPPPYYSEWAEMYARRSQYYYRILCMHVFRICLN